MKIGSTIHLYYVALSNLWKTELLLNLCQDINMFMLINTFLNLIYHYIYLLRSKDLDKKRDYLKTRLPVVISYNCDGGVLTCLKCARNFNKIGYTSPTESIKGQNNFALSNTFVYLARKLTVNVAKNHLLNDVCNPIRCRNISLI